MFNQLLAEEKGLKLGLAPQSVTGSYVAGSRISLKDSHKVAVVIAMAASASAVLNVKLEQHDAASGGNTQALAITNHYFHKVGSATEFTKVEVAVAEDIYDLVATVGNNTALVVFEINESDLDVADNFSHISVSVQGDATARIVSAVYVADVDQKPAYSVDL
jgi:hypothetical protein